MSGIVDLTPQSVHDLDEIFEYLSERNPAAARKFNAAARRTFEQLSDTPGLGVTRQYKNSGVDGVLMLRIHGFHNYLAFYIPASNGIRIIRVLHSARNVSTILEASSD